MATLVAEPRLANLPVHALRERIDRARCSLSLAQTPFTRRNAMKEIEECTAALKARGYQTR